MALLADVHSVQRDLHAAVRARPEGPAQTGERVRAEPAGSEHLGLDLRLRAWRLDADIHREHRLLDDLRAHPRRAEPVALEVDRVADPAPGACQKLRADPRLRLRPL